MMFGPSDKESTHSAQSMAWKIKRESNDSLRQTFVNRTIPQGEAIGITVPDPDLKWIEAEERYEFGPIQWDEFWNVVKGNGPCNKERLHARKSAHEKGEWVRQAAAAYAAKQRKKAEAAA